MSFSFHNYTRNCNINFRNQSCADLSNFFIDFEFLGDDLFAGQKTFAHFAWLSDFPISFFFYSIAFCHPSIKR